MRRILQGLACAAAVPVAMSCSEDGAGPRSPSYVQVALTDAPASVIGAAEVWISRIYLVPSTDSAKFVVLFEDQENPRHYDLLDLRNGLTADLTDPVAVESGEYTQLRLVVDSARVTLAEGYTFWDGTVSRSLKVPSGSENGIKVRLAEPLDAEAGQLTVILVDFDVERNFVVQGNPDTPAGIQGILFTPTLVEKGRNRVPAP